MSEQWPQDPRWQQPQHGQRRDNAPGGQGADGWSGGGWNEPVPHQAWSPHPSGYERIAIRQRIALTINRFEIRALDAEGNEGALLAMAEQKRLAMREQVTFWTDETRREAAFSMKARQVMDIAPTFDVWDGAGQPLGWFRKEFGKSFLRTTWTAEDVQGNQLTGTERSPVVAILRRLFGDSGGAPIGSVRKVTAGGSEHQAVVAGLFAPYGIAIRGNDAYVTTGAMIPGGGEVHRISLR